LRTDSIAQAIRDSGVGSRLLDDVGYRVAYSVAEDCTCTRRAADQYTAESAFGKCEWCSECFGKCEHVNNVFAILGIASEYGKNCIAVERHVGVLRVHWPGRYST
jgi:hypothetical protein